MKYDYIFRFFFYFSLLAVLLLAMMPPDEVIVSTGWDKANHTLAFFVLLGLFDISYPTLNIYRTKITIILFYGVFIEILQLFSPDRFASLLDVLADSIGLFLYLFFRPFLMTYFSFFYKNPTNNIDLQ